MFCRRMTVKIAAVNKRKELVSTHTPLDLHQGQGIKECKSYSTLTLTLSSSGLVPSPKDQIDEEQATRNKR